ncbi:glucosamine inositolphosphorylceramide transferase family protein [Hyphomicrobium album]|uniref:glucosamine inositolphosphorylceramide transferase family protein n=1 Tax=Hyphomicrobium album TaxID=2665159 RepID=UPI0018AB3FC3|nr:hypothetical protein [Hyphomicrobium album]
MKISVCLNPEQLRRWHCWLIDRLVCDGHAVRLRYEMSGFSLPSSLAALLMVQRTLSGGGERASDRVDAKDLAAACGAAPAEGVPDVEINLTGEGSNGPDGAATQLWPLYDGARDEAALWLALLQGRAPVLGIGSSGGRTAEIARPVLENPHSLPRSADNALSRLVEGIARALPRPLEGVGDSHAVNSTAVEIPIAAVGALAWNYVQTLAGQVLANVLANGPSWRTAWRRAPEGRTHLQPLPGRGAYSEIATDGERYYADPFVIFREGMHHVFVEELPYATQKGIISHVSIDARGNLSRVTPVLECAHHLSYPQIIEHEGEIYMLPEASASGALDLYKAKRFPYRWAHAARLIDAPLHDATLFRHDGRFYITAGMQALRSASYDALGIYSAPSLFGPWTPNPGNPVLVDGRFSRPAGDVYSADGSLWRPIQNGTRGYGAGLEIARITAIDATYFAQEPVASHAFAAGRAALGPHTLNWAAGIEVVDYFANGAELLGRKSA